MPGASIGIASEGVPIFVYKQTDKKLWKYGHFMTFISNRCIIVKRFSR